MFLCSFALVNGSFAQKLSDQEVVQMAIQAKKSGASETEIAKQLIKQGATAEQLKRLRSQYAKQAEEKTLTTSPEGIISTSSRIRTNNAIHQDDFLGDTLVVKRDSTIKKVFGRDIFNNKRLSFEPQMNIATPQNYVVGPGDQLIIDIYGASQQSLQLTVSPDGDVTVPEFGPIRVSGLSINAAQARIRSKLGSYYQSSEIKTSLGQTRSIMVNVMGEVRVPGTYTLSAFALAGNVRLQDNDVIQVGTYDCIVDISGKVKRPMAYEMKPSESLSTLIKYSGGFTGDAYKNMIRVLRKSEDLKSVYNVEEFDMSSFKMTDGDSVIVDSIINRYKNMVEIKGAVYRQGMYHLGEKITSVRSLIEMASGLTEEAMISRAVLRRMKPNRTQQVISVDLKGILNGSVADIPLQNEDILFIPTLAAHQNLRTLTIDGEVIFPGTYEYAENMTIEDLILQAGGLTDAASTAKVDVSRQMRDPSATEAGMEISKTFSFSLKDNYMVDGDRSFTLEPYDIVQVRMSPAFQTPIRVTVEGEVAFQGNYTMEQKNQRLSDVVKAAGGVVAGGYVRGARLERRLSADEKARMQAVIKMARQSADGNDSIALEKIAMSDTYTVGIHLDEALANPGSTKDVELMDGDRLVIPRFNHTVRISGDVNGPNTVAFEEGKGYKYFIEQAGGFGDRAKKRHAYIVYQNGTMAIAKKGKIEPGCEIVVPSKSPNNNKLTQWLGIGTSMASLATMFVSIANLIKK